MKKHIVLTVAIFALSTSSLAGGMAGQIQAPSVQMVDGLVVKYKTLPAGRLPSMALPISALEAARLSGLSGVTLKPFRGMAGGAQVLKFAGKMSVSQAQAAASKLMKDPNVFYAEPDLIATPQALPNDPYLANQWDLGDSAVEAGAANVSLAWNQTTGVAARSIVGVIDTGILPHADLAGRVLPGYDMISNVATANDGDGRDPNPADPGDCLGTR